MDPEKIKKDVGVLTIGMLNQIGLLRDGEIVDGVELFSTTDAYMSANKDVMVIASVNNGSGKFVLVSNGLILNKADAKKLGKEAEISQLYLDRTKAALLQAALVYAFPELKPTQEKVIQEKQGELFKNPDSITQKILKSGPDVYQTINLNPSESTTIDESIGYLKKKISELEEIKSRGFEKIIYQDSNNLSFSKEKITKPLDSDLVINTHLKNKEIASQFEDEIGNVTTYNQKDKTYYISWAEKSRRIKIIEVDVPQQIKQKLDGLPLDKVSKAIVVDENLAKKLLDVILKIKVNSKSENET